MIRSPDTGNLRVNTEHVLPLCFCSYRSPAELSADPTLLRTVTSLTAPWGPPYRQRAIFDGSSLPYPAQSSILTDDSYCHESLAWSQNFPNSGARTRISHSLAGFEPRFQNPLTKS